MALRQLVAACVGLMWAWLAGNAMAADDGATTPPLEQVVTARTPGDLLQALQPWVAAHLLAQVGPVQVQAIGGWHWPAAHGGAERWRVTWEPAEARRGDWLVSLNAVPDQAEGDGLGNAVAVRFVGRPMQTVWRARAPLKKGDPIDCALLSQDTRAPSQGTRPWQGRCEDLVGLVARRPIGAGEVLTQSDAGLRPAVQREQAVNVLSRSQGIVIQARGQALADASVGQRVPVRIAGHDRVLQATVTAPGELQIMEGMQ